MLLRRVVFYLVTGWIAVTLNFLIPRLMPGDPAQVVLQKLEQQQQVSPGTQAAIEALFGTPHQSLWRQYGAYLHHLAHLDFGVSTFYFPTPVSTVIADGLPWTLALVGVTTALAFLLGTGIGIVAGIRPGSRLDSILAPLATVAGSLPYFWVATILVLVFAITFRLFPAQNGADLSLDPGLRWPFLSSAVAHAVLPAATIILSSIGGWILGMRNMMVTTVAEDYVLLAEAKGLARWRVMLGYAARNAMLPQVSGLAIALGSVVGGSLLAEIVFAYPGVGYLLEQAVVNLDYPLMQALFLIISLSVLAANFLADSVYVLLDPRTREPA
ncbi:MAG TPA: ABC transporter permease [Rugosimonospora sp.]|nr:ABC transporter permease [Rugosimonospora sp.]